MRDVLDMKKAGKTVACPKLQKLIDKMKPPLKTKGKGQATELDPWADVDAAAAAFAEENYDDDDDAGDDVAAASTIATPDARDVVDTGEICRCPLCVPAVIEIDCEDAAMAPTGKTDCTRAFKIVRITSMMSIRASSQKILE